MSMRLSHRFSDPDITAECYYYVPNPSFLLRPSAVLKFILVQGTELVKSSIKSMDWIP
jgi:hypothetical protein